MVPSDTSAGRRQFLKWLAASPLLPVAGLTPGVLSGVGGASGEVFAQDFPPGGVGAPDPDVGTGAAVADVKDVLNIFDLQETARKTMLQEHYMWLASGVEDELTLRANRQTFTRYQFRARQLGRPRSGSGGRSCSAWARSERPGPTRRSRSCGASC